MQACPYIYNFVLDFIKLICSDSISCVSWESEHVRVSRIKTFLQLTDSLNLF
jgi:hypothetical protein